jgi:hypothetical protein
MIDFALMPRNSGKTRYLKQKIKEYTKVCVLVPYKSHGEYQYREYNYKVVRNTNDLKNNDIPGFDCFVLDEVIPTVDFLQYCQSLDIDVVSRATPSEPINKDIRAFLAKYYPEELL